MTEIGNQIRQSLERSFDFKENYAFKEETFSLYGAYFQRNSQYFAVKKAELYAFSNFEHLFLIDKYAHIKKDNLQEMCHFIEQNVKAIVKPDEEHMSSVITLIFECDCYSEEAAKFASRYKYNKSHAFGLKGWTQIKLILIGKNDQIAAENKAARGDAKKLKLIA